MNKVKYYIGTSGWFYGHWIDSRYGKNSKIFEVDFTNLNPSQIKPIDIGITGFVDALTPNYSGAEIYLYAYFHNNDSEDWFYDSPGKSYLFINNDNKLTFYAHGRSTTKFFIRIKYTEFGDDFILNFKAKTGAYTEKGSSFNDQTAIDQFIDFFAAFDEQLIYEAEMFIEEGTNDYNNQTNDYRNNQSDIKSWTCFKNFATVNLSVAYSWDGTDSVEGFNNKLEDQRRTINDYYSNTNSKWKQETNPHPSWSPWTVTRAPGDDWYNYLMIPNAIFSTESNPSTEPFKINGYDYFPYMPGFGSYIYETFGENYFNWTHSFSASGIDCSGYIQRSSSYAGNNYRLPDFYLYDTLNSHTNAVNKKPIENYSTDINANAIVPGDILYRQGHVVFVREINLNNLTIRDINNNKQNVTVIEASPGDYDDWRIIDYRTWQRLNQINPALIFNSRRLNMY